MGIVYGGEGWGGPTKEQPVWGKVGSAGEIGPFQDTPSRLKALGLTTGSKMEDYINANVKDIARLWDKYHDEEKVAAAWNAGEAAVDRALKNGGANWKKLLPSGTASYAGRVSAYKSPANESAVAGNIWSIKDYQTMAADMSDAIKMGWTIEHFLKNLAAHYPGFDVDIVKQMWTRMFADRKNGKGGKGGPSPGFWDWVGNMLQKVGPYYQEVSQGP